MKIINLKSISIISLLMIVFTVFLTSCEPGGDLIIKNQHDQAVTIYLSHVRDDGTTDGATKQGTIPANSEDTFGIVFLGRDWINRIMAKDLSDQSVFSHDYKMDDLEKIDWKITIPP